MHICVIWLTDLAKLHPVPYSAVPSDYAQAVASRLAKLRHCYVRLQYGYRP